MSDVLIVEPSKDLGVVIAQGLARQERSSSLAHSAQSAIAQSDKSTPRLVILELIIPKHNGLEFIHEFRSYTDWVDIPIIIYSQMSSDELPVDQKIFDDMGVAEHLYKPTVSLSELINKVEKYLS